MIDFGPQLGVYGGAKALHFRTLLFFFWGSRWGQVGTKSLQKSIFKLIIKTITFRIALGADFDRFWAPKWPPRGGPRNQFSTFFELLGPSWLQDGTKSEKSSENLIRRTPWAPLLVAILGPQIDQNRAQERSERSSFL